jgi:hypothetical protein
MLILLWIMRRRRNASTNVCHKSRRFKTRPVFRRRNILGEMVLINEIHVNDAHLFHKYFRMTAVKFDDLLARVGPTISGERERWSDCIGARQKLAMTLRLYIADYIFKRSPK